MNNRILDNKKKKAVYIGLKLNKKTDADILGAIGGLDTRHKEIKRLMRLGLKTSE